MKIKKTQLIAFRTTEETREYLQKEADKRKWSLSQMINEIILEYIEKRSADPA